MKKALLVLALLSSFTGQVKDVGASAIPPSTCSVKAEVINLGDQMGGPTSEAGDKSPYIDLKILEISQKDACPIEEGQIFRAIDNYPGTLKKGARIHSAISSFSSMGPAGPVSFLQWSMLTYEDGSPIKSSNHVIIDSMQSDQKPFLINS